MRHGETTAEELRNAGGVAGEFGIDGEDEEELMGKYVVVIANPGYVPARQTPIAPRTPYPPLRQSTGACGAAAG